MSIISSQDTRKGEAPLQRRRYKTSRGENQCPIHALTLTGFLIPPMIFTEGSPRTNQTSILRQVSEEVPATVRFH
jgi:hypothetical protein